MWINKLVNEKKDVQSKVADKSLSNFPTSQPNGSSTATAEGNETYAVFVDSLPRPAAMWSSLLIVSS